MNCCSALGDLEDDQRLALRDRRLEAGARLRHVHEGLLLGLVVVRDPFAAGAADRKLKP